LPIPDQLPVDFAEALERARPRLGRLGSEVFFFDSIGSTSDVAATLAAHGDREGAVVVAGTQTAGRGRRGRTWFSPPSSGLYVSLVLTPGRARVTPDRAIALLTLAAGVALAEAVELVAGLAAEIKWPNDLFLGRRKLAGILAEGVTRDAVVLGYGINVGPMAYPRELSDRATSLELELGRPIDRASLLAETLAALAGRYDDLLEGRFDAILDAWRARAPGSRGARVSWETLAGPRSGITAGVDERGALLVDLGHRMERIVAGELRWF
jgi:BirA family transcriptional regulator, biotin operon repressor / biotin---[acetyl-CoA-carboxylase] ligase